MKIVGELNRIFSSHQHRKFERIVQKPLSKPKITALPCELHCPLINPVQLFCAQDYGLAYPYKKSSLLFKLYPWCDRQVEPSGRGQKVGKHKKMPRMQLHILLFRPRRMASKWNNLFLSSSRGSRSKSSPSTIRSKSGSPVRPSVQRKCSFWCSLFIFWYIIFGAFYFREWFQSPSVGDFFLWAPSTSGQSPARRQWHHQVSPVDTPESERRWPTTFNWPVVMRESIFNLNVFTNRQTNADGRRTFGVWPASSWSGSGGVDTEKHWRPFWLGKMATENVATPGCWKYSISTTTPIQSCWELADFYSRSKAFLSLLSVNLHSQLLKHRSFLCKIRLLADFFGTGRVIR